MRAATLSVRLELLNRLRHGRTRYAYFSRRLLFTQAWGEVSYKGVLNRVQLICKYSAQRALLTSAHDALLEVPGR